MSIHGFVDQNGQIQKYDYNDLENIPDTIGEEIVLVQDVQPIEENNKIWLPLTQSSNTVEVPTMDEFNALAEEVQSGGLSEAAKEALLTLLQHVAYIDEYGQDYYDDLEEALAGGTQYTITNNLTGCTTSNSSTKIVEGHTYTATITASSGYTLTGATATATMGGQTVTGFYNNGTISIPNVTGDLVITVTATSAITSISAVFTQGSAVIYDTDSLDTLKQYLVVTATYTDSTTTTVTDYTLSGTLTAGTSTITVSYGGKADTFDVTVTSAMWFLTENYTLNKSTPCIDTGIPILSVDQTYTIFLDVSQSTTENAGQRTRYLLCVDSSTSPAWKGIYTGSNAAVTYNAWQWMNWESNQKSFLKNMQNARCKVAYVHEVGTNTVTFYFKLNDNAMTTETSSSQTLLHPTVNLTVGSIMTDNAICTVNKVAVYKTALTADQIAELMA